MSVTSETVRGTVPAPKNSAKAKRMDAAAARHAVPFVLWVGILLLAQLMHLTPESGTEEIKSVDLFSDALLYALRTLICLAAIFVLRPWKFYRPLNRRNIIPAVAVGAVVFILWTFFEWDIVRTSFPILSEFYVRWCVLPFGELRAAAGPPSYSPAVCGWELTLIRFLGSVFVITVIEEFFWRGYVLRAVRTPDFLDIDIGELHWPAFLVVCVLFSAEHMELAAGFAAGIIYGLFYIKSRDVWAVSISHAVTNALLGLYVIATGSWQFW